MHLYLFFLFRKEQYLKQADTKYNKRGYINHIEKLKLESLIKVI